MEARTESAPRLLPAVLALVLIAHTASADSSEEDGLAPWVGDLYRSIVEDALGGDVGDGLGGLVPLLTDLTPSTEPVWDLVRWGEDMLRDPPLPDAPGGPPRGGIQAAPGSAASMDPVEKLRDASGPLDQGLRDLGPLGDRVPTAADALERLAETLSEVGGVPLDLPLSDAPAPGGAATELAALGAADAPGLAGEALPVPIAPVPPGTSGASPAPRAAARASPLVVGPATRGGPEAVAASIAQAPLVWLGDPFAQGALAVLGVVVLLAPPLFHRLQRHRLLEQDVRARLHAAIVQRPGAHIEELARAAGVARSTAVYHLQLLERHGLVLTLTSAKAVHYYPNNGQVQPHERARMAVLASPRTREVAAATARRPGIDRAALAAELGITLSTLSWHLGKLFQHGLVTERRVAASPVCVLDPAPDLAQLLTLWDGAGEAPPGPALGTLVVA